MYSIYLYINTEREITNAIEMNRGGIGRIYMRIKEKDSDESSLNR